MTRPIVLVHGLGTSSARTWGDNGWYDILGDLGRDVVGLDMLGHGTAPKPTDPGAYARLEDDLLARLPAGPVDAVGFSAGARALLVCASREPERFASLVVAGVGANVLAPLDEGRSTLITEALDGRGDTDDPFVRYYATLAEADDQDPEALAAFVRRPRVELTDDDLARIVCPVLVVIGDRDDAGPAEPLVERLPHARAVTLKGVDHFATPKSFGFVDAVLDVLERGA